MRLVEKIKNLFQEIEYYFVVLRMDRATRNNPDILTHDEFLESLTPEERKTFEAMLIEHE